MIKISNIHSPQKKDLRAIDRMIKKIRMDSQVYYGGEMLTYGDILRKREYVATLIKDRHSKEMINRHIKSLLDSTVQMLPLKLYNEYIQLHSLSNGSHEDYVQIKSINQIIISLLVTGLVSFGGAFVLGIVFQLPLFVVLVIGIVVAYVLGKILL